MQANILLQLKQVSVSYADQAVIQQVDAILEEGQIGCLLGSSGCGKTTLLRAIAGFEQPQQGEILLRNKTVYSNTHYIPPEKRNIGMVFQDFALFPHMNVAKNIAFGLLKATKALKHQRVTELLNLVGLPGAADKYPHQLSGGQQQRIALARAMAPRPDLLLMDEPFSSLDIELREQLATEVRNIIKHEGITAILVTHDQHEAFAMADKIGLIQHGRMLQWDTPYKLYHQPKTQYAAHFIGQGVMLEGQVMDSNSIKTELGLIHGKVPDGCQKNCLVDVLIRPDDITHDDMSDYQLEIIDKVFRGAEFLYTLKVSEQHHVLCIAPSHHNHPLHSRLGIKLEIDHIVVFKRDKKNQPSTL